MRSPFRRLSAVALVVASIVAAVGALAAPAASAAQGAYAVDTFSRTVANGWGTADTGGAWSLSGTAANFHVASGVATMNQPTVGVGQSARLLSATSATTNALVDLKVSKAGTGSGNYVRVIGRRVSTNNEYRGRVRFAANGAVYAAVTKLPGTSTEAVVGTEVAVAGLTYNAATTYRVRVVVTGANPSTIQVKVWNATQAEPAAFAVTRTDSQSGLQAAGSLGIQTALSATSTNAPVLFTFDNLSASPINASPVAVFTPSCTQLTCSFDASASHDPDGTVVGYSWSFGDGANGAGVTANHLYSYGGSYTVTLTVTDNLGATGTTTQQVAAGTVPSLTFAASDPTVGGGAEHETVVEPTTATFGTTIVSTYQVGRFAGQTSGSQGVGFATSTDGGVTWPYQGVLPGTSQASSPAGPWQRTVNMIVTHDDAHGEWIITSHGLLFDGVHWSYDAVTVSRSTDGINWNLPVLVGQGDEPDKGWVTCDNSVTSPHYGRCYLLYTSQALNREFKATYSDDGGLTWSSPIGTASQALGYDVNPVVRPDGTVVVLATQNLLNTVVAFGSIDGGLSWSDPVVVATEQRHTLVAGLRTRSKPSAAVDAAGNVYVSWYDCRFRVGCTSNDIVYSTSSDGVTWGPVQRIPLDPVSSTIEHFVAAIGITPGTSGATAQLTVVFYEMPNAACTVATCAISAATAMSNDAGATWSPVTVLNSTPMNVGWLPMTTLGHMLADYYNVAYVGTTPVATIPIANKLAGSTADDYRQHLYFATL